MQSRILIVEDEMLVAFDMQDILESRGYECVAIAADYASTLEFGSDSIDLALVDLNLRDGLTGPQIGARLRDQGVAVIFITANPAQLGDGVAGTIGVLTKPTDENMLIAAVDYAFQRRAAAVGAPPSGLRLFG